MPSGSRQELITGQMEQWFVASNTSGKPNPSIVRCVFLSIRQQRGRDGNSMNQSSKYFIERLHAGVDLKQERSMRGFRGKHKTFWNVHLYTSTHPSMLQRDWLFDSPLMIDKNMRNPPLSMATTLCNAHRGCGCKRSQRPALNNPTSMTVKKNNCWEDAEQNVAQSWT